SARAIAPTPERPRTATRPRPPHTRPGVPTPRRAGRPRPRGSGPRRRCAPPRARWRAPRRGRDRGGSAGRPRRARRRTPWRKPSRSRLRHLSRARVSRPAPYPSVGFFLVMRVFIISDMEGVAGIVKWQQTDGAKEKRAFHEGRELYTEEINAAVRGARTAGAKEIVVMDCHGAGEEWTFNSL